MAVRSNYLIEDTQKCIYSLLAGLESTTAPWTRWDVVLGWPETDVFKKLTKPFLYVLPPTVQSWRRVQGGKSSPLMSMTIGAWDDRKTGGTEEINIVGSRILALFGDPQTVHTTTFTVTLDSVYTGTTLKNQGVYVDGIFGPREIATEDVKEFRTEFELYLIL